MPRTQDLLQLCVGISQGPQMVPNQWIAGLFLLFGFLAAGWGAKKYKLRYFVKLWARMKQVSADYSNGKVRLLLLQKVVLA